MVLGRWLPPIVRLIRSQHCRNTAMHTLAVLGLLGQVVLLCLAAYLVDLSISLMELWAELARKHLELTM